MSEPTTPPILLSHEEILRALSPLEWGGEGGAGITGVSLDSRTVRAGELFVAIRGEKHDGHRFLESALQTGCRAALVDESFALEARQSSRWEDSLSRATLYVTENTTAGLQSLARFQRGKLTGRVLGVTGSSGKTSTRDMLYSLAREMEGSSPFATRGNLNNHWGLPLSLLSVPPGADPVILEMGMNHAGEIALLSSIARPSFALITSVSEAHAGFFRSVEEIAAAKLEIAEGMGPGGLLVYNISSPGAKRAVETALERGLTPLFFGMEERPSWLPSHVEYSEGSSLHCDGEGISFRWRGERVENKNYFSSVMAWNLLGALTLLHACGYGAGELRRAASRIAPRTPGRFQLFRRAGEGGDSLLVDDSYNANPDSFRQAILSLREILPQGRLLLVAGEMAELGSEVGPRSHAELGRVAAEAGYGVVALAGGENIRLLGEEYLRHRPGGRVILAPDPESLLQKLEEMIDIERDVDGTLVKGSRSARMDLISAAIKERGYV